MRLNLDPMPALRAAATKAVNERFNEIAAAELQRDMAHRRKREIASAVQAGDEPPAEFTAEADLRGIAPEELASVVLAKPNAIDQRELARQTILLQIEASNTPADIEAAEALLPG